MPHMQPVELTVANLQDRFRALDLSEMPEMRVRG